MFLHNYRYSGSLEEIRDDLGLHLKSLRSQMIELINEDYADFVNLSANLIGLDRSIQTIANPVKSLREEVINIKDELQMSIDEIREGRKEKIRLMENYRALQYITELTLTAHILQQMLGSSDTIDAIQVERIILLLCHVNNYLEKCEQFLKHNQLQSVNVLKTQSMNMLRTFFLSALHGDNKKNLEVSLRMYSILNVHGIAEAIYRADVLKPHLQKLISEQNLQNAPKGLRGIYDQIIEFVETNIKSLLELSKQVDGDHYDFLLRSYWAEVEHRLEVNMSSIFAPGNPNFFYQKYQCTMEFLHRFEGHINHPEAFRNDKQYKSFLARWNLPVYFQIRFQEIGGIVENEFTKAFGPTQMTSDVNNVIRLIPVTKALENISKCWSDGVYLDPLMARFLKLTLQIYGRLCVWLKTLIVDKKELEINRVQFLMIIYNDLRHILASVPPLIQKVKSLLKCAANISIDRCFNDVVDLIRSTERLVLDELYKDMSNRSQAGVRQVADIPRLFRKTNREIPTKACPYVEDLLSPTLEFRQAFGSSMDQQQLKETMARVLSQINVQYVYKLANKE